MSHQESSNRDSFVLRSIVFPVRVALRLAGEAQRRQNAKRLLAWRQPSQTLLDVAVSNDPSAQPAPKKRMAQKRNGPLRLQTTLGVAQDPGSAHKRRWLHLD